MGLKTCKLLFYFFLLFFIPAFGQKKVPDGMLPYEKGFVFKQGIYNSFIDFKENNPSILTNIEIRNDIPYYYNDSAGKMMRFNKKHWGYSSGKNIYLNIGHGYSKVAIIGSLCYFAVVYAPSNAPSVGISSGGGFGMGVSTSNNNNEEYMLDMQTGKVLIFTKKNLVTILKERDQFLYEEFKKYKGRKDARLHYFLNAYNSYHPLYLPE